MDNHTTDSESDVHAKLLIPPIKIQGIKSKLINFIKTEANTDSIRGVWIEPFMGSGVVLLNLAGEKAIVSDNNPHLIRFMQAIQSAEITSQKTRQFLETEGEILRTRGEEHYYAIRDRFNNLHQPLDFLFINRACFNGLMRFNRKGGFNTPFCRKPQRFDKSYVTKITNQVAHMADRMNNTNWQFSHNDWRNTLAQAKKKDFVYLDPPYLGRHADYHEAWNEEQDSALVSAVKKLPCRFAFSMWLSNVHRTNDRLLEQFKGYRIAEFKHQYHVGAKESQRGDVIEALVVRD